MKTALYSHADTQGHVGLRGYQENPDRVTSIIDALDDPKFNDLVRKSAPNANREDLIRVHSAAFIDFILQDVPADGDFVRIDYDTALSPGTASASLRAAGALCQAVDDIIAGEADNAFCLTRPPGHHAEPDTAMGFCFFSNIAVAAKRARDVHGIEKIAVVDFDVHHGNGTQASLADTEGVYFGSIHQHPHYPNTGLEVDNNSPATIRNVPLLGGTSAKDWQLHYEDKILKEVDDFKPDLILVSAGFDAHEADPLGEFNLTEEDYHRLGKQLVHMAQKHCNGRLISSLEGGYNLDALGRSAAAYIEALHEG